MTEIYKDLKEHQVYGVDWLSERKNAYLADRMGAGKTIQAIRAASKLGANRILITTTASMKHSWFREWNKWDTRGLIAHVVDGIRGPIPKTADVYIVNYDLIIHPPCLYQLLEHKFSLWIGDEAHYLKTVDSQRTQACLDGRVSLGARSMRRWMLSGSPILNRPLELYPVLASLAPEVIAPYNTFEAYARYFCGGHWEDRKFVAKGATHTDELRKRLYRNFMLRRSTWAGETDTEHRLITVPAEGVEGNKLLTEELDWHNPATGWFDQPADSPHLAIHRRELGEYIAKKSIAHIRHLMTMVDKLVVFAYHRSVMSYLAEQLKSFNPVAFTGGMSARQKLRAEQSFKQPGHRIFLGQFKAAGEGLDLTTAHLVLFVESGWSPGEIDQPARRCQRITQTEDVQVQYMVVSGSYHETMISSVAKKRKVFDNLIEKGALDGAGTAA